jgi:putative CocE/NonD family hydrolase
MNYLVVGPWNHGGWSSGEARKLGPIDFGSATGKHFREKIQVPWFAYHLKDKGKLGFPEALTFQTGTNRWVSHEHWPPLEEVEERKLYFQRDGRLAFDPPAESEPQSDSYVSDPARPVPYRTRPISPTYPGPDWREWLVQDQRFVHLRPDVLSWETEALKEEVVISGNLSAHLFGATTGTDCDWIVKLIDVYPEDYQADRKLGGYQLMIANDVFRGRFRKGFVHPEPIEPGQVDEYVIDLHGNDHCFRKGHKIMVQVQSTWFPVIDRNPQKYVANIFEAKESDYQPATQRVFRCRRWPSHVSLPVVKQ